MSARSSGKVRPRRVRSPRIVHQDDRRSRWLWLLAALLLAVALWQAYQFGRISAQAGLGQLRSERDRLSATLAEQQRKLTQYQGEAARYQRQAQVEQEAGRELQKDLVRLEEERARLRSEVRMLKGLISNDGGSLYVRDFSVEAGKEGTYRYRFTLVQVKESVETTRGKLVMKLSGLQGKKRKKLDRSQFSPDGEKTVKLEFKHYQDVEGEIRLPEGFTPKELKIEFLPRNKELKKLEIVFPWSPKEA